MTITKVERQPEMLTITQDTTIDEHNTLAAKMLDCKGNNVPLKLHFNCENGSSIEIDTVLELDFY
jgi:hypothetical protein